MTKSPFVEEQKAKQEKLLKQLAELLGGSHNTDIWLKSPHQLLEGRTPQSYLDEDNLEVLEYFVHAIATGQPS